MLPRRSALLLSLLICSAVPALAAPKPGEAALPITLEKLLQAPDGAVASLDAFKGKAVVLEFWATWCGPCIAEIPRMNKLVTAFKDKPVQFISITDEDPSTVESFLKQRPMSAWIGFDPDQSMFEAYGVYSIPHVVLVDPAGKVAAVVHPGQLTDAVLADLIAGKPLSLR